MRLAQLGLFAVALTFLSFDAEAARPKVDMFGAAWCGPCRLVRSVLDANQVAYRYHDIDTPNGRAAYQAARGSSRSIPLVVVGRTKIVGANIDAIGEALGRQGLVSRAARTPQGEYGGRSAQWWQGQFRALQAHLDQLDRTIAQFARVAVDNIEKEQLAQLRESRDVVKASIQQLKNDASRVALPRKYRK